MQLRRPLMVKHGGYAAQVRTARVAQLAEQCPCKAKAAGSNPARALEWQNATSPGATASGRSSSGPGRSPTRPRSSAGTVWERFELLTTAARAGRRAARARRARERRAPGRAAGRCPTSRRRSSTAVRNPTLVALGGGRVIDTAKAIAAVRGGRVCAIPTTLSGRRDDGNPPAPGGPRGVCAASVRPTLVIADPVAMTTLDDRRLRASAMNALAPRRRGALHAARQPRGARCRRCAARS